MPSEYNTIPAGVKGKIVQNLVARNNYEEAFSYVVDSFEGVYPEDAEKLFFKALEIEFNGRPEEYEMKTRRAIWRISRQATEDKLARPLFTKIEDNALLKSVVWVNSPPPPLKAERLHQFFREEIVNQSDKAELRRKCGFLNPTSVQ